jgi:exosortase/archaeosortase family protein
MNPFFQTLTVPTRVFLGAVWLPFLELVALRYATHQLLDLHLGLPGFVDFDLLLPVPIAMLLFFHTLSSEKALSNRFSAPALFFNFICCLAYCCWASEFHSLAPYLGERLFRLVFWILVGAVAVSGLIVNFPFTQLFSYSRLWVILPSVAISLCLVIGKNVFPKLWPMYAVASAETACFGLKFLSSQAECRWFEDHHLLLHFEGIGAFMGATCAGWDSVYLFVWCFLIFTLLNSARTTFSESFRILLSGLCFAFLLNQVRILGIFTFAAISAYLTNDRGLGNFLMTHLFHVHAGWILYTVGFSGFFIFWGKVICQPQRHAHRSLWKLPELS